MIKDELHGHGGWQWRITQILAVAQLQPGRPVGEGAEITANSVFRFASGN